MTELHTELRLCQARITAALMELDESSGRELVLDLKWWLQAIEDLTDPFADLADEGNHDIDEEDASV